MKMKKIFNLIILSLVICLSMFTTSCSASPYGRFERISDMNVARVNPALFLLSNGKVLIFGGDVYRYKDKYGTWIGTIKNISAEMFDPKTNKFTLKKGLNNNIYAFSTATLLRNNKLLITGGSSGQTIHNTSEIYDPETDTITKGPDMNFPRAYHQAVLLNDGRVLILGGTTGKGINETNNKTAEIYDPVQNKFILLKNAPVNIPDVEDNTQILNDGTVCILNRHNSYEKHSKFIVFQVEIFDLKTNEFRIIKFENQPRTKGETVYRCEHAVKLKDDRIVLFGSKNSFENEIDIYDYKKNEMQSIGHMNAKNIFAYKTTLLNDGNILITGGSKMGFDAGIPLNTAEIFDTTKLKFYTLPKMKTKYGSTILLKDGSVLKVGGSLFVLNSQKAAEVFIPNKK